MRDVAAATAGDANLGEELRAFLDHGEFDAGASLRAGNGRKKAGGAATHNNDFMMLAPLLGRHPQVRAGLAGRGASRLPGRLGQFGVADVWRRLHRTGPKWS